MMKYGVDILIESNPEWKKKKIALVTNQTARTVKGTLSRIGLLEKGFNIVRLFSPEHGLMADGADGHLMYDGTDNLTKLPFISLYADKLSPTEEDLKDIDIVLFDIPDVGCRYYTYLWTMTYVLEACAAHQKKLIILDRPNPLSGIIDIAEGPELDENSCSGFTGRWNIPLRHSCTMGELALYFSKTRNIRASLEIIPCEGWKRDMFFSDWEMEFVPTSPAIRNFNAALLYPGLGLLEATNISEGRGTAHSFEIAGAPWLSAGKVMEKFNLLQKRVELNPYSFTPSESKCAGENCSGFKFEIRNTSTFESVKTAMLLIKLIKDFHPKDFRWNTYPTNVNPGGERHLDKLLGIKDSENLFELSFDEFDRRTEKLLKTEDWKSRINPFLLYT